ncbi:hypothetical protein O181_075017 [Austropuccinia psidii MF-1]|uniref:Integrase catalytic domain-containing protein n=1 Tax=Austropuccinia psidii MF-1 TaxID=1389203 RepID=A0A9Q3ICH8_9BASI|nr:hypothetical protein [Austropuccinia psidii MF-1]
MLIQYHYSSSITIYPLRNKSEAGGFLIDWIRKFNNLTKYKAKRVRMDNVREFMATTLKNSFVESGITHETIVPYEHHQAGKIECTNRKIAEAAISLLTKSNLNLNLWPYAFRQAVSVFNHVPHGMDIKTPYEIVTTQKSYLSILRVFGSKSFVHNLTLQKDRTPNAKELVHLGVAEN